MFKEVIITFALVVLVSADNRPYQRYDESPMPYSYQYRVRDDYYGSDFNKQEQQDAYGNLKGQYRVVLPDGRTQIVTYTANHQDGFLADVQYDGKPTYSSAPSGGYRNQRPSRYN